MVECRNVTLDPQLALKSSMPRPLLVSFPPRPRLNGNARVLSGLLPNLVIPAQAGIHFVQEA